MDVEEGRQKRTGENVLECKLDVAGIEGRGLDEGKMVVACGLSAIVPARSGLHDALANCLASSVGTALRCRKSLLLPTSMMTMLLSAWSRSSFSHRVTFSYVWCLLMS